MSTPRDEDDNDEDAVVSAAAAAAAADDDDDEVDGAKVRVKVKVRKTPSRGPTASTPPPPPVALPSSPSMPSLGVAALPLNELRKAESRNVRKSADPQKPAADAAAAVVRSPWDVLGAKAMTDHAKKPKQSDSSPSSAKGSFIGGSRHTMPLFASELVERGDDSTPSTPATNRGDVGDDNTGSPAQQVPPPLPPSPKRDADEPADDAVVVAAPVAPPAVPAYDETEDLAPYPSTRCSPISIESLASALEALGVPLTAAAGGARPTSPANKSERRHTMKPHTLAPSPPSANASSAGASSSSPAKASGGSSGSAGGSAVGARRAAAKEKRKTATLAQTH